MATSNIKVIDQTYTETTRDADPDDEWDSEDTHTDHDIRGIQISEKYFDLTVPFEVVPKTDYWLVYGIYSTGDSFHTDEGIIEFVDLFQTREKAEMCVLTLEEHDFNSDSLTYEESAHCILTRDDGTEYRFAVPWVGFFENLTSIGISQVSVIEPKKTRRRH